MKRMVREEAKVQPVRWMGLTGFICFYFVDKENNQSVFIDYPCPTPSSLHLVITHRGYSSRYPLVVTP